MTVQSGTKHRDRDGDGDGDEKESELERDLEEEPDPDMDDLAEDEKEPELVARHGQPWHYGGGHNANSQEMRDGNQ